MHCQAVVHMEVCSFKDFVVNSHERFCLGTELRGCSTCFALAEGSMFVLSREKIRLATIEGGLSCFSLKLSYVD